MSAEANKSLVGSFYQTVWNGKNPDATGDYYTEGFVDHNPAAPGLPEGVARARQTFVVYLTAFPDITFTIDLQIAEGDLVSTRWSASGTNSGSLLGMPPTGRSATVTGIDIFRVAGGKIVERWGSFDGLGMMQQLGLAPGQ
jgi:predicted ester cyclase